MRHAMWMGPRGYEMWVPMPAISPAFTRASWGASTPLLNGGTTLRQSKAGHNIYALSWNTGSWDDLMPIRDMADGVYDRDDEPTLIYFLDPTAAARNLLPQAWATPGLAASDALPLLRGNRPTGIPQDPSTWRLPARAALYGAGGIPRRVYVPIPPGMRAYFGWVGSGTGVEFAEVTPTSRAAVQTPAPLSGNGTWTNASIARSGDTIGVEVGLAPSATATVRAMTLQVLPAGRAPRTNVAWAGGMGHSGCQFQDKAGLQPLSVPLDLVAASATLEETGAWL